jgi:hypothetical protein
MLYHKFKSSALTLSNGFTRGLVIGGVWLFVSRFRWFSPGFAVRFFFLTGDTRCLLIETFLEVVEHIKQPPVVATTEIVLDARTGNLLVWRAVFDHANGAHPQIDTGGEVAGVGPTLWMLSI